MLAQRKEPLEPKDRSEHFNGRARDLTPDLEAVQWWVWGQDTLLRQVREGPNPTSQPGLAPWGFSPASTT